MIVLREHKEGQYIAKKGDVEILVRESKGRWSYTLIQRTYNGGYGRYGSAQKLEKVLRELSQHLSNTRVWLLLEDT